MNVNIGCGNFRTDLPNWINTDVVRKAGKIEPDVVVSQTDPFPFDDGSFELMYMGHVLEHVPWEKVVPFLEMAKTKLANNGKLLIVGPDINRCLDDLLAGKADATWFKGVLEDDFHVQEKKPEWFGAHHCWNAYEERVIRALKAAGFKNIEPLDISKEDTFLDWPVTSHASWQMAVIATK